MDKLSMATPDLTSENIKKVSNFLKSIFPECVKEAEDEDGNLVEKLDFDLLKASLGDETVGGLEERYRLDWPGKKRSILKANTPITKTLRPVKEDSVDWDKTQNLYIEGDNFEVLKILQESYLGQVKMIYIDPPYNTGNDFVYNDDFAEDSSKYKERTEQGAEGYKMVKNTDSNGRFHSDWLSMMYERLRIARDFLTDDGVIFISIDDTENANLQKICEEIFDGNNYEHFIWKKKGGAGNTEKIIGCLTENILCYFKNKKAGDFNYQKFEREYKYEDAFGKYNLEGIEKTNLGTYARPTMLFDIIDPKTNEHFKPSLNMRWTLGLDTITKKISENKIFFDYNKKKVYVKKYESDYENSQNVYYNLLTDFGSLATAKEEINKLFGNRELFDTPKPTELLEHILTIATQPDSIVLDFFSGSASMGEAVLRLNSKDKGTRKFIMVQIPELCNEDSEAYKEGYKNICEIGKERIRRAGKKIKEETGADIDYGFRVYKVDESCMKDVYYHPSEARQENLLLFTSNIKEDRTPEDLLTQVILNLGLTLDLPIEERKIGNNKVFYVAGNSLIACFDENIDLSIIEEVAKDQPIKLVFCDSCFRNDEDRINVENKVRRVSPETKISVI